MSDLALRRLEAFFIDFFILGFLYMVCMGVVFLTADMRILLREKFLAYACGVGICTSILAWIYFFLLDYYENLDVGKRLTNIEIISDGQKLTVGKKLKHSFLKCICGAVWPVSGIYYLIKEEMIYDRYLGISIRDKLET